MNNSKNKLNTRFKETIILSESKNLSEALLMVGFNSIHFESERSNSDGLYYTHSSKIKKELVLLIEENSKRLNYYLDRGETLQIPVVRFSNENNLIKSLKENKGLFNFCDGLKKKLSKHYGCLIKYPAKNLFKMDFETEEQVIKGVLPNKGLCSIVGGSDSGKSLFTIQLAISYCLNKSFVGLDIKGGKDVVYFALEDSQESIAKRLKKLSSSMSRQDLNTLGDKLYFDHEGIHITEKIEEYLNDIPDLGMIIIDTYSDLAAGKDMNNSGETRQLLNPLHQLCIKNDILIIFIHHINKGYEQGKGFNKLGISGSQSFEAKMRSVAQMIKSRDGQGNTYYSMAIIKGNDVDEQSKGKDSKLSMKLDTKSLWFRKIKEDISVENQKSSFEQFWKPVFEDSSTMTTAELKLRLQSIYRLSNKTSEKRILSDLKKYREKVGLYNNPFKID